VASTIARQIDVELTPNEQARFAKPRPLNPDALEVCFKGVYFLGKQTSDGFQKAKVLVQCATVMRFGMIAP